jgi:hypothetical protein
MSDKPAKTGATRGKKRLPKWQRDALTPPEIKRTDVMLQFDEASNIRAVTVEEAQRYAEELNSADDQVWTEIKAVHLKNRRLLGKRARDAMGMLFAWAIATEWCAYGEWISPLGQEEMLECFCDEALSGIIVEQAPFRKKRSRLTDKAYDIAKPHLLSFRQTRSIPNNQPLTPEQGRQIWPVIMSTPRWKRVVTQHAKTKIERLTTEKGYDMSISVQYQMVASSRTLRVGADNRWKEEFGGDQ